MLKTKAGDVIGRTPARLLTYEELRAIHGVPYTRQHLSTLEKADRFPRRINFDGKVRWLQSEVEDWIAQHAAANRGPGWDARVNMAGAEGA
jgi:predicted DNA-binding transcriptional regulator AlpA